MASGVAILVLVLYALRHFFDPILGEGATAILTLILTGVAISAVLIFVGQGLNNSTHRAAGEDITEFANSWSKTQTERARIEREYARMEREQQSTEGKLRVLDERRVQQLAMQAAKALTAAEVAAQKAEQPDTYWDMESHQDHQVDVGGWRFHE